MHWTLYAKFVRERQELARHKPCEIRDCADVCGWQQAYRAATHATKGYLQLSLDLVYGPQSSNLSDIGCLQLRLHLLVLLHPLSLLL